MFESVSGLSNLRSFSDGRDGSDLQFRTARPEEIDPAVRKLLLTRFSRPDDRSVMDYLNWPADRKMDLSTIWVAVRGGNVETAVMPIVTAGKTVLLLLPRILVDSRSQKSLESLCQVVCDAFESTGMRIV